MYARRPFQTITSPTQSNDYVLALDTVCIYLASWLQYLINSCSCDWLQQINFMIFYGNVRYYPNKPKTVLRKAKTLLFYFYCSCNHGLRRARKRDFLTCYCSLPRDALQSAVFAVWKLREKYYLYLFPPALESLKPIKDDTQKFLADMGRRIFSVSGDDRKTSFLFQRTFVLLCRFRSAVLRQQFCFWRLLRALHYPAFCFLTSFYAIAYWVVSSFLGYADCTSSGLSVCVILC